MTNGVDPGTDITNAFLDTGLRALAFRLYDNVQTQMPSVQVPVMQMELWNVVQDFCRRSTYFRDSVRFDLAPFATTVNFNPYSSTMSVFQVLDVWGLHYYTVKPPAMLVAGSPDSYPRHGWAWLALKPTLFAASPPILFDLWFEAMLNGLLARLAAHPGKPYSSPQKRAECEAMYRAEIRRARDQADRFNSDRQPNWRFPYFAGGVRKN
jgi:hypothetical protein